MKSKTHRGDCPLSNNSFEWVEVHADGKFEPLAGETVVDMGIRD